MRQGCLIFFISCCLCLALSPSHGQGRAAGIFLTASPSQLPADGKSVCTISAEVRDIDGNLAPDGTEINFTSNLGVIEETGETSSGVARVKLVASDIPGKCVVTATWLDGQASAQITVEFSESIHVVGRKLDYFAISASDYLAYSWDYKTLDALGNVVWDHSGFRIQAAELQYNVDSGRVVAKGRFDQPIVVSYRGNSIECEMLSLHAQENEGLVLKRETGVRAFSAEHLVEESSQQGEVAYFPGEFDFVDLSDSAVVVKAKSAVVFPNDRIQFRRAKLYVDGKRMLSLPLYVLSLTEYQPESDQYIGYSTSGLALNVPFYYSLSPRATGVFLLKHGQEAGWGYGRTPGWYVDLRQRYVSENSEGAFTLSRITGSDWGAHFFHTQQFDKRTQGSIYLDYPAHEDLYGTLTLNKALNKVNMSFNVYGEHYSDTNRYISDFVLQTKSKPIGKSPFRFNVSSRTRYVAGAGNLSTIQDGLSETIQGNISSMAIPLSRDLDFRSSLGVGYVFGATKYSGLSIRANALLNLKLSANNRFQLGYRFSERSGFYPSRMGKQSLTASLNIGDYQKWRASIYAIRGLDSSMTNVLGDFTYRLSKDWRFEFRSTSNEWHGQYYDDLEIALGKRIGNREIMAVWSQSQRRITFELGSSGF